MDKQREIENKFRQYNRVLISYIDFQQAVSIASLILDERLHDKYPRANRIKLQALNSAMVTAYCRPFSGNRGDPDLPQRFINNLTKDEREIHDALIKDRDSTIAHSDSEAWNMRPHYQVVNGKKILVPLHHSVHSPFLREPTERIRQLAEKQRDACLNERLRLERELEPFIPIAEPEIPAD